jgi:hypothetical protein
VSPATLERRYAAGPLVAYHEAGHAIIAHRLGRRVERVALGFVRDSGQTDLQPTYLPRSRALIALAGERAERRCLSWLDEFTDLHHGSEDRRVADEALAELAGVTVAELVAEVDQLLRDDWLVLKQLGRLLDRERVLEGAQLLEALG